MTEVNIDIQKCFKSFMKWKSVTNVLGKDYVLSKKQEFRLSEVFKEYGNPRTLQDRLHALSMMIKNDLPNYKGRIKRLKLLSASPTKKYFLLVYGKKEGISRYETLKNKRIKTLPSRNEFWINKGYTIEEARKIILETQIVKANKSANKTRGSSEFTVRSVAYWIKMGYSEEDAKKEVSKVQSTFSLRKCIEKYGEEVGTKIWKQRQNKWQQTLNDKSDEEKLKIKILKSNSVEAFILKGYSEEEAEILSANITKKRNNFSNISQKLFEMIYERLYDKDGLYFKNLNYEKQFFGKYVDFYDKKSRIVIEFYGDFWHRNPKTYNGDFTSFSYTSTQKWDEDKERVELIKKDTKVADVIIIWESDFRNNPTKIVENIIHLLKEKRNELEYKKSIC